MSVLIRRISLAALVAALVCGSLAIPASAKNGPVASASKCKKAKKKGKHKKRKKKCGGTSPTEATLPGQATHSTPNQPPPPPPPLHMSGIGVTDNPILGGNATTGQVTIDGAAPSGGQTVTLQSSDPARGSLPASVVVPSGQTAASFPVNTTTGATTAVTLTAWIGASSVNTQLNVVSGPSVASVALERQCFTPGPFSSNRVSLDIPAPADTVVDLSSDAPLSLSVPSTVTVPSGSKSALFDATAMDVPAPSVTVTATLGSSQATDSASVSGTSPNPAVSDLSLAPSNLTAGNSAIGTVTLDCEAPSGGMVVNLSSDLAGVTVPTTVTVPQNQLSTTFRVDTLGTAHGTANISADTGTGGPQTAQLQVDNLGT